MKHGTGSIRRQAAGRSLFAEVSLAVAPNERSSFAIDFEEDAEGWDNTYLPTIQAAITFAEEKYLCSLKRPDLSRLSVILKRLVVTTADSTCTAVFYATLLAIEDALEVKIPDIEPNWAERELRIKF